MGDIICAPATILKAERVTSAGNRKAVPSRQLILKHHERRSTAGIATRRPRPLRRVAPAAKAVHIVKRKVGDSGVANMRSVPGLPVDVTVPIAPKLPIGK